MIEVDRFRLYLSHKQEVAACKMMEDCRILYNACLYERREGYKRGSRVNHKSQELTLTTIKNDPECPDYNGMHTHALQDVVTRLDRSFDNFFRRVEENKVRVAMKLTPRKPGYPRFRAYGSYRTINFKQYGNGVKFRDGNKKIYFTGLGDVKVKVHREMIGQIRQIALHVDGDGHWYAIVIRKVDPRYTWDPEYMSENTREAGLDLGLKNFLASSDGKLIQRPRFLIEAQRDLARKDRTVKRRVKGSKRREKARADLARAHSIVANARRDFHHKTARELVRKYGKLAVEDLNIVGLCRGWLAKHMHDAAWGQFLLILAGKALDAGRTMTKVNPRGSTQECHRCGEDVPKDLSVRIHKCPCCGLAMDRDENAALNIHGRVFGYADDVQEIRLGRSRRREALRSADLHDPRSPGS